jgi:release factor glutamine methyltransferase
MLNASTRTVLNYLWQSPNGKLSVPVSHFRWQLDPSVTIGLAVVAATQRLGSAGLDTPRLDSEVLLGHVLGLTRAGLYTHSGRRLSDDDRWAFEELIDRRFKHEPVAYLVGRKAFYGIDLAVDERVLIPRPETELLVDLARDVLGQAIHAAKRQGRSASVTMADVGTGSGAIALAVAANMADALIYAIDISPAALALAKQNATQLGLAQQVTFLHGDLLTPLSQPVDLIVANLPYVAEAEWGALAPDIADFEPALALSGGPDGLTFIRQLLQQAPDRLSVHGVLLLEIGAGQGSQVAKFATEAFPDAFVEVLTDYGYRDRIVRVQT